MSRLISLPLILIVAACGTEGASPDAQPVPPVADTSRFDGIPSGEDVVDALLPTVDAVLGDDRRNREFLHDYARRALHPQTITTQGHLTEVFALRDSVLAHLDPRVEEHFAEEVDYSALERFVDEARSVGLEPISAEGMLFGVGAGNLLPEKVAALATEDFRLYTRFQTAKALSMSGEYPFLDLEPQRQMILFGEELVYSHQESTFIASVQTDFEGALRLFMSLHRAEGEQWCVGPATNDFYPWASGDAAHQAFAFENETSRFHKAVQDLLRLPSDASAEQLDVVVAATSLGESETDRMILENLERGIAMQRLSLRIEDGPTSAAVYRYFPAGDPRVQQAVSDAQGVGLEVQVFALGRADVGK